jgi:serpin B
MSFMSEKFKKDLDNIKLNDNLKNKTIAIINQTLAKEKPLANMFSTRKSFIFTFTSLILIVFIIGITLINGPFNNSVKAEDLMQGIRSDHIALKENLSKEFLDSTSEFSISMFKELSKEQNAVYSPTSLYLALGTVLNGADGSTKDELLKALSKYGLSSDELNIYYKTLVSRLSSNKNNTTLSISNSIWFNNGFDVNKGFLNINKNFYNTSAYELNLQADNAKDYINTWGKKVTNNKINNIIERIDKNDVMIILSSIYFNANWQKPFPKSSTRKSNFTTSDHVSITTDFMCKEDNIKSLSNNSEQIVSLPYSDGNLSFVAMMPNEQTNIRDYISSLNKDSFANKISSLTSQELYLSLPKFEAQFSKSIKNELSALGIKELLDRNQANLSKISTTKDNLFVSEIAQNTYLKADENGTEASSITKVDISKQALTTLINFNRPFVYAVIDNATKLPLFIGVMDTPNQ